MGFARSSPRQAEASELDRKIQRNLHLSYGAEETMVGAALQGDRDAKRALYLALWGRMPASGASGAFGPPTAVNLYPSGSKTKSRVADSIKEPAFKGPENGSCNKGDVQPSRLKPAFLSTKAAFMRRFVKAGTGSQSHQVESTANVGNARGGHSKIKVSAPSKLSGFSNVVRSVQSLGSDLVQHVDGESLHVRFKRRDHTFQTLTRLGWPEENGDLLLVFRVLPARRPGVLELLVSPLDIVLAEPGGTHTCQLRCQVEHSWECDSPPVLVQVQGIVENHASAWLRTVQSPGQRPAKQRAPRCLLAYIPVLVKHIHERLQCLEMHCAVCDGKVKGENGCAPKCKSASCDGDCLRPCFQPPLCASLDCKEAICMQARLPLYLHPASLDLLITLAVAALQADASRRHLIFGDTAMIDNGHWLQGMCVGQTPQWGIIKSKLEQLPRLNEQAPALGKAHQEDSVLLRLISWVVLTFDGVLLPLQKKIKLAVPPGWDLFLVQAGNRERAAAFKNRKHSVSGKTIFAFHGSPLWNWHSIVRQDIKNASGTPWQANGSSCGPGIYMCADARVVAGYCASRGSSSPAGWSSSCLGSHPRCIGLCELVGHDTLIKAQSRNNVIVAPDERDVTLRALLVQRSAGKTAAAVNLPSATLLGDQLQAMSEYKQLLE